MPGMLGRKWPVAVAAPMAPFYAAGLVILYGVNSFATVLASTDEYKNDPRNTGAKNAPNTGGH